MKRIAFAGMLLGVAITLAGCAGAMDTVSNWFSTSKKSNLKGERISLLASDETIRPDPTLANMPVVLPAPYHNPDWAQPGGFPSNATYHLDAPGPLHQIWDSDAGKGSDSSSRLQPPTPVMADAGAHLQYRSPKPMFLPSTPRPAPRCGTAALALEERHRIGPLCGALLGNAQHHRSRQRHGRRRRL